VQEHHEFDLIGRFHSLIKKRERGARRDEKYKLYKTKDLTFDIVCPFEKISFHFWCPTIPL
jgi:hypothetical protein